MHYRMPDFDLRPRRATMSPTPMRSTFDVDDEGDTLDALVAVALGPDHRRDARHTALAAMPSSLCQPVVGAALPVRSAPHRAGSRAPREPMLVGSMLSAALALVMVAAALLWRLDHPRVVHLEDEAAVRPVDLDPSTVDAVSSATRRASGR